MHVLHRARARIRAYPRALRFPNAPTNYSFRGGTIGTPALHKKLYAVSEVGRFRSP